MNAAGKIFNKLAIPIFFIFFWGLIYIGYNYIPSTKKLEMPGSNPDTWYVMGTDGCAALDKDTDSATNPQEYEDTYSCSTFETRRLFGSINANYYVLDCRKTMEMHVILVKGITSCTKAYTMSMKNNFNSEDNNDR